MSNTITWLDYINLLHKKLSDVRRAKKQLYNGLESGEEKSDYWEFHDQYVGQEIAYEFAINSLRNVHGIGAETTIEISREELKAGIERIYQSYELRIVKLMEKFRAAFLKVGLSTSEVDHYKDDDHVWSIGIYHPDTNWEDDDVDCIDLKFVIVGESSTDEGINFMVDMVTKEGRDLGGYAPENGGVFVWVDVRDEDAVERRFEMMLRPNFERFAQTAKEYFDETTR
jgi:hypothetical protein